MCGIFMQKKPIMDLLPGPKAFSNQPRQIIQNICMVLAPCGIPQRNINNLETGRCVDTILLLEKGMVLTTETNVRDCGSPYYTLPYYTLLYRT